MTILSRSVIACRRLLVNESRRKIDLAKLESISMRSFCSKNNRVNLPDEETMEKFEFKARRACLYVPGSNESMLAKSSTINADCLIFDIEDGVAPAKKEEARHSIVKHIQSLSVERSEIAVRINGGKSEEGEKDLEVIMSGEKLPQTILVPKVESSEDIDWFAEKLGASMKSKDANINLLIYIESARALLDIKDICNRAVELSEFNFFHLDGIVFGSDDFIANIGAEKSRDGTELLFARQNILLASKAFKLQAIDQVYIDYRDSKGLREQCKDAFRLGFTGKQAIHPDQVPIIQSVFTPSQEKLKWAVELIPQFLENEKDGKGAFVFQGQMIDKPLYKQAVNIVRMADPTNKVLQSVEQSKEAEEKKEK